MTEEKKEHSFQNIFYKNFVSESKEPAIAYVENFLKRKFETVQKADLKRALINAAEKGGDSNNLVPHIMFVRELMNNTQIMLKFNKEERMEIFVHASRIDKKSNEEKDLMDSMKIET